LHVVDTDEGGNEQAGNQSHMTEHVCEIRPNLSRASEQTKGRHETNDDPKKSHPSPIALNDRPCHEG